MVPRRRGYRRFIGPSLGGFRDSNHHQTPHRPLTHCASAVSPVLVVDSSSTYLLSSLPKPHPRTKMTLVTRSAIRLSRRGGASLKAARANAAFFTTAASTAQNVLPKSAATASRVNVKATQGEFMKAMIYDHDGRDWRQRDRLDGEG